MPNSTFASIKILLSFMAGGKSKNKFKVFGGKRIHKISYNIIAKFHRPFLGLLPILCR